jgi:hypothetical protein
MNIFFSNSMANKFWNDNGMTVVYGHSWKEVIMYVLNSDFRKSVNLRDWLNEIVMHPSKNLLSVAKSISSMPNPDLQVKEVQNWVFKNVKYVTDGENWKMSEHWNTPDETLFNKSGDCEDGAILMYVLARLKGVSDDRLLIMAGTVSTGIGANTGGHAWLSYRPFNYPLSFVFLDWCYYSDLKPVEDMILYNVKSKFISSESITPYKYIWFGFNESNSFYELNNKFK